MKARAATTSSHASPRTAWRVSNWYPGAAPITPCPGCLTANELVKRFHTRMPVILTPDRYAGWLAHDTPAAELLAKLVPLPAGAMEAEKLAPVVNNVRNDGPEFLTPAA
jgi:putative SOS response-associated peptidase YedK